MNTILIQQNRYYYICEVSGFRYIKLHETEDTIQFEAVLNKARKTFKSKFKKDEFKNQIITKYKKDIKFL